MSARRLRLPGVLTLAMLGLLSGWLPSDWAAAQESSDTDMLTRRVNLFFDNLEDGGVSPEAAFEELLFGGPLANIDTKQFQDSIDKYKRLEELYGKFLEAAPIDIRPAGDDVVFLTYFYKTERFPVVWRFVYYRPPTPAVEASNWFVVRLSFDTKLEELSKLPQRGP